MSRVTQFFFATTLLEHSQRFLWLGLLMSVSACDGELSQEAGSSPSLGRVRIGGLIVEMEYVINEEGQAIVEGDIIVEPMPDSTDSNHAHAAQKEELATINQFLWPVIDGYISVPYVLNPKLTPEVKKLVTRAMDRWEAALQLKFVVRTTQTDYLSFDPSTSCSSPIGRVGGKQSIALAPSCLGFGAVHEIGHALGAFHEHTRTDRDEYIDVKWNNISKSKIYNFNKYNSSYSGLDRGAYDYRSIMHYASTAFAVNANQPSLTRRDGKPITTNISLTENDICFMKKRYFPSSTCETNAPCTASLRGNDTKKTAFDASAYNGMELTLTLCRADISQADVDWFKFYIPAGKTVRISVDVEYMALALFTRDTQVMNDSVADLSFADRAYTYTAVTGGYFYLAAAGSDQVYKLKVQW